MAEFYRMYEARVYAFARNRLNDPHAAADIVNETMLAVWRGAHRFRGQAKVSTWLLGIAHNKIIDCLRRRRGDHDELDDSQLTDDVPASTELIARAEDADAVHACLAGLSDEHRQVMHLVFFEELSYPEIAEIVEVPEGTVKSRMFHARKLLKRCLESKQMNEK